MYCSFWEEEEIQCINMITLILHDFACSSFKARIVTKVTSELASDSQQVVLMLVCKALL